MTSLKSSNFPGEGQNIKKDLKKETPMEQKIQESGLQKEDASIDVEEEQTIVGASGDSMSSASSNKDDENYGKGKNIPTSPSGLV